MPGRRRRRRRREQQYSERELFCFLVLAVATGYGRLNRVSFHACAIDTICAILTIQAGGGCGVCDCLWPWERKEKEPAFVCASLCV